MYLFENKGKANIHTTIKRKVKKNSQQMFVASYAPSQGSPIRIQTLHVPENFSARGHQGSFSPWDIFLPGSLALLPPLIFLKLGLTWTP